MPTRRWQGAIAKPRYASDSGEQDTARQRVSLRRRCMSSSEKAVPVHTEMRRRTRMSPEPELSEDAPAVVVEEAEELLGNDEAPEQPTNPIGRVQAFYERLSTTFSWRYVAIVSLVYGVNQGVGEACLFTAQKYYLFDDLRLTPARYSKVDGFANIPWQVKALYGMVSDSFSIYGLRKTPYIILASIGGIIEGVVVAGPPRLPDGAALVLIANPIHRVAGRHDRRDDAEE